MVEFRIDQRVNAINMKFALRGLILNKHLRLEYVFLSVKKCKTIQRHGDVDGTVFETVSKRLVGPDRDT